MTANLASILQDRAATDGARPALLFEGQEISYAELERRTGAAAALFVERGVRSGDRVAIKLGNCPEYVAAFFGALRAGAVVVPLNILLAPPEIHQRVEAAGVSLLIDDRDEIAAASGAAPPIVAGDGADPAVILFTSGTSGGAKGAVLTHAGIRTSGQNIVDALSLAPEDVMLGSTPFTHVLGQTGALVATFLAGGAVLVVARFEPTATMAEMVGTGTTILLGVPTMCISLCELARSGVELPPIRIAHVGGAPVPIEVIQDFERTFAGSEVFEGYGLTEISGIGTTYGPGQPRKVGSVGTPRGDIELRIVSIDGDALPAGEIGEIALRGSSVIAGYWNNPEETAAAISPDGWLATGDMGHVDDDGYLYVVDRKKELILRGGFSVYPREVEEVLYAHPDVLEAAVVGVPDDRLGEEIAALVVPRPGAAIDPDALRAYTRERVAAYKYPRHVLVVDALPKGPTGKILKRAIDHDEIQRLIRK